MSRTHYSKMYDITSEVFSEIVKTSTTYSEIIKKCGYKGDGCNINTIKRRILLEKINDDHIRKGYGHNKGRRFLHRQISLENALKNHFVISNKNINFNALKSLIQRYKLKEYKCEICKMEAMWQNKLLSLQLHHINGNKKDNRLENLSWLCPNCHSQTENFSGKTSRKICKCFICGDTINRRSKVCLKCLEIKQKKIKDRPSNEKLLELTKTFSCVKVGNMFNVSSNTIKKWCLSYGIIWSDMRGKYERK